MYQFAAVVFVGGSLVPRGGHNIIEPAAFAKPIIVGKHTGNFRQIVSDFARRPARLYKSTRTIWPKRLFSCYQIAHSHARWAIRRAEYCCANRGACERTIAAIKDVHGI